MLLGDLIAQLEDDLFASEAVLRLGNLGLLRELEMRAAESGMPLGDFTAWAVRRYADNAPADEWTTLIGIMERADDPGGACLERALAYVLAARLAPGESPASDD